MEQITVRHRQRLLSDNGSCFIAKDLEEYLTEKGMGHTRGKPHHPQTQGKIERHHRSLKNVATLQNYYVSWELEHEPGRFVDHYNHERVHESLQHLTPADVYVGRARTVLTRRERIKQRTLIVRRQQDLEQKEVSFVTVSS